MEFKEEEIKVKNHEVSSTIQVTNIVVNTSNDKLEVGCVIFTQNVPCGTSSKM
jgi:hypothetical protein